MGPMQPFGQVYPTIQGTGFIMPGIFPTFDDENDYLSSLDSDTRDYVVKHTDDFRTRQDVIDCVYRLHHGH
jgi:hypothetical protein